MKFLFALISTLFFSCKKQDNSLVKILEPEIFNEKVVNNPDVQLIDVRTLEEVNEGYIANAVNVDFYADDFKEKLNGFDKTKPVAVYCKKGGRSGKAAKMLTELGFKEIYDLKGGYTNWTDKKLPITKSSN